MYISKIRVKDYKCFRDSGDIEFKPGINIIVGQNNSGKTTLLEALEIKIRDIPHRSLKTPKNKVYPTSDVGNSILEVSLQLGTKDLPKLSEIQNKSHFKIPLPKEVVDRLPQIRTGSTPVEKRKELEKAQLKSLQKYIDKLINKFQSGTQLNFIYSNLNPRRFNLDLAEENFETVMSFINLMWKTETETFTAPSDVMGNRESKNLCDEKIEEFRKNLYRFDAERPKLGKSTVGLEKNLMQMHRISPKSCRIFKMITTMFMKNLISMFRKFSRR
jgi:predicted ATP-dependent endonuclease of OLD family